MTVLESHHIRPGPGNIPRLVVGTCSTLLGKARVHSPLSVYCHGQALGFRVIHVRTDVPVIVTITVYLLHYVHMLHPAPPPRPCVHAFLVVFRESDCPGKSCQQVGHTLAYSV